MSYVTDNLRPGEQLVLEAKVVAWPSVVLSLLWSWVLVFIPSLILLLRLLKTELGITNKRVLVKAGVLSTSTKEAALDKIQNISYSQSLLGKILNYGTVSIQTAATSGREGLRGIGDPKIVRETLLEQMELYRVAQVREQAEAIASSMRK